MAGVGSSATHLSVRNRVLYNSHPFLVLFTSLLAVLSFPKFAFSSLAWIALAPLAYVALHSSPRRAFFLGWCSGTLAYSGILFWLIVTFQAAHQSLWLAAPCLLALSAYLGAFWGLWAWFVAKIGGPHPPSGHPLPEGEGQGFSLPGVRMTAFLPFAGASAWVALEYLRTYLFSGFPWTLLGDSQVAHLYTIQLAAVTGIYGVSFLVCLVSLSLAWWAFSYPSNHASVLVAAVFVSANLLYGYHRVATHAQEKVGVPIRVALLQGNIDQYKKWDKAYVEDIEATYSHLALEAKSTGAQLILWPETAVPGYLLRDPTVTSWVEGEVKKGAAFQIIGTPFTDGKSAYNAAFSFDPSGKILGFYSKSHLVPFGEVIPFGAVLGRWIRVLNDLGGFAAANRPPVIPIGYAQVGVNICYEAIFPALVRKSVKQGAEIIANLTNDGWYMRTAAPFQHFTPNVFRAIENNRWLIRADNTGISAIIDPVGHVVAASPIFQGCVVTGNVFARRAISLYTRFGDVFAWCCCLFSVLALFISTAALSGVISPEG